MISRTAGLAVILACVACSQQGPSDSGDRESDWLLVDDFEAGNDLQGWSNVDVENNTDPFVPNPQVSVVRMDSTIESQYMLRKPAADGVVGNRKAIGFKALPVPIPVGASFTLYTRVNVEYFPNNHSFGLSNLSAEEIPEHNYDALEPTIRITDKAESDGQKNDGTLMVLSGYKSYSKIIDPATGAAANPMEPGTWYEIWCVVNNAPVDAGGQRYDLYMRGGEFGEQQQVFAGAVFRMQRALPLTYFMAISNTGPHDAPYGNGGVRFDDIYMANGVKLTSPQN